MSVSTQQSQTSGRETKQILERSKKQISLSNGSKLHVPALGSVPLAQNSVKLQFLASYGFKADLNEIRTFNKLKMIGI